ncbi:MAG: hypothetical protein M0R40_09735 [Firmicutes bacterium]|nr:hypothetical protein [Bacillota bacterium]
MSIEGTIEVINNSSETFWNSGNIIAIIVSVISIIGSIIVVVLNNRASNKISEHNNNFQEKMNDENTKLQAEWHKENLGLQEQINKANIDANLIANARIEWIQKVRNLSAELLSLYFSMLNPQEADKFQIDFNHSIEKTELLILYFGHEDDEIKNADMNTLLNRENNKGKNELIVSFLISLSQKLNKYNVFIQKGGLAELQKSINKAQQEMYHNVEMIKVGEYYHEEAEEMMDVEEPHYQTEDILNVNRLEKEKKDMVNEITNLQNDLIFLRNIIRTYLKIEWNKAKLAK